MSKQIILQKYCVECGEVSSRVSFGGINAFHFLCWLRWLWRGLTKYALDGACACREPKLRWKESSGWYCSVCYKSPRK